MRQHYRLGIDVGTNSLGWCSLKLDELGRTVGVLDVGVRIFPDSRDPKSGTSLASDRRLARSMRRRRDRYLKRRDRLMEALVRHGLMPSDIAERKVLEAIDPYEVRARGLDEALSLYGLGRALFHLGQRRGFKSNRKTDKADDKETGVIKQGVTELHRRMAESGASTLGEYLYRRQRKGKSVRARPGVGFYPSRAMYENEFDALWAAQVLHHPDLTDVIRNELREIILFQRPLRPVDPGNCELDPEEKRAPLALPLSQKFRMYQELNILRIRMAGELERPLGVEERDKFFDKLQQQKTLSFGKMRKLLGFGSDVRFNLEDGKRKALNGDKTGNDLASEDLFGPQWWEFDEAQQDEIVEALLSADEEDELARRAQSEWGLSPVAANKLASTSLVQGYGRLGRSAMAKIVPVMRDQGLGYAEAAAECGYHHSDQRPEVLLDRLPYYGEVLRRYTAGGSDRPEDQDEKQFGKLANPTVHVGLNQLRKLVNALIAEYGCPSEIVVELARDLKLGREKKQEVQAEQAANQRRNERIAGEIEALKEPVTGENIRRYKLWEELGEIHDRRCVYTDKVISARMVFSAEVDIDHILPFSHTLDDSMANRTLCLRSANRDKGNRAPVDAFGESPTGYDYEAIQQRAEALPRNKRWRFAPDAMERYEGEHDFIARQLNDTAYLARVARQYLSHITPANKVWVSPGRLTAMLRGKWGLNSLLPDSNWANTAQPKNRNDHRHHAIDAFVVGVTDRGLLHRVARAAEETRERLIAEMPEPWEGFRDELRDRLQSVVVSHKLDHGRAGRLHEDTAYGVIDEDGHNLVFRKPFPGLTAGEVKRIRDQALRTTLASHIASEESTGRNLKQALDSFRWPPDSDRRVRHVRLLKKEANVVVVNGADGAPYKALIPGNNYHIDIYETTDGKWAGEAISVFDANQENYVPGWRRGHRNARLVMRVHKGDLLILDVGGVERVMRIYSSWQNVLQLAANAESGDLQKRHKADNEIDPFRWTFVSYSQLAKYRARRVSVDMLGRVHDSGPPE